MHTRSAPAACGSSCRHHKPLAATEYAEEVKHLHVADLISTNYYERPLGLRHTNAFPPEVLKQIGTTLQEVERIGSELPFRVDALRAKMDFVSFFST